MGLNKLTAIEATGSIQRHISRPLEKERAGPITLLFLGCYGILETLTSQRRTLRSKLLTDMIRFVVGIVG